MKTYELYSRRGNGGPARDRSADDLERDVHHIRSEMSQTLRAIESKLTGGGDAFGRILGLRGGVEGEGGSGDLLRNLGEVARANPVPVALIATGIGAILLAGTEGTTGAGARLKRRATERVERYRAEHAGEGGEPSQRIEDARREARGKAEQMRGQAREKAEQMRGHAREKADQVRGQARERAEHAREELRERRERAREGLRQGADRAKAQGQRILEEEPLVLAGLGIAAGAMISAAIPIVQEERARMRRESAPPPSVPEGYVEDVTVMEPVEVAVESTTLVWEEPDVEAGDPMRARPDDDPDRTG